MTFLYALATLWLKVKQSLSKIYPKILESATTGHKLVYVRQAFLTPVFCFILFSYAHAQSAQERTGAGLTDITPLIVGQKVPEEFWDREHLFYVDGDTLKMSMKEHRGKLVILDFWSTYCAICLHHMKHSHSFLASYGDTVALIPVNPQATKDSYRTIVNTHNRTLRKPEAPGFSSIYSDVFISKMFPIYAYPTYVWIGPTGNVLAITTTVSEGHIRQIIDIHKPFKNKKS
ncbi:TlpA family protein disulfide reductase [Sphingobacterium daejeonense]|uniref:TlpA family protein disulfide reductase n=1 Tax=Sphingobacterium daejeonense TaxID=371142 RepID=UPI003D315806